MVVFSIKLQNIEIIFVCKFAKTILKKEGDLTQRNTCIVC